MYFSYLFLHFRVLSWPKIMDHVSYQICLRANFWLHVARAKEKQKEQFWEGGKWQKSRECEEKLCQSLHLLRAHSILNEWPAWIFYLKLTIQFHLHFNGKMCRAKSSLIHQSGRGQLEWARRKMGEKSSFCCKRNLFNTTKIAGKRMWKHLNWT